jgi:parvulin-like peptidyl-prolyl isomerase
MTKAGRLFSRAIAIAVLVLLATSASAEVIDRIVAVVGGQIITQSDVDAVAAFGLASNLQELIDRTLMLREVRRVAPPDPAPAALEARVARIRANFTAPAAFARALELSGLDEAGVRAYAADDLRLSAYLDERFSSAAQPSEEEVRQAGESARDRLIAERRQTLVNAWIAELRRRTDITVLQ